jgi:hypothetical protein
MDFRKFIGWIISWVKYSIRNLGQGNVSFSYSELLKKVQELEKLIDHMSAENEEMQMAFFRNIYHEVRTPMNSILGFSSLLEKKGLSEENRNNYADHIWKSSAIFLQFIDDLVEASMLETQLPVLEYSCFSVKELMTEIYQACNRHRHLMEKNSVALLMSQTNFSKNVFVETDRRRLIQLIEYLTTGFLMDQEMGVIELGYKTTLNNGLVFTINTSPVNMKTGTDMGHINRASKTAKGIYDLQLRRRSADKLIGLFGGTLSMDPNRMSGHTARVIIKPKSLNYSEQTNECNTNNTRIAI